jgi:hypothetical protein
VDLLLNEGRLVERRRDGLSVFEPA